MLVVGHLVLGFAWCEVLQANTGGTAGALKVLNEAPPTDFMFSSAPGAMIDRCQAYVVVGWLATVSGDLLSLWLCSSIHVGRCMVAFSLKAFTFIDR